MIRQGELESYEQVQSYNGISPALVLCFKNGKKIPIREHRFLEYIVYIDEYSKKP